MTTCNPMGYKILKKDARIAYINYIDFLYKKIKFNEKKTRRLYRLATKPKLLNFFGLFTCYIEDMWICPFTSDKIKRYFFWNLSQDGERETIVEYNLKLKSLDMVQDDYIYVTSDQCDFVAKWSKK